MRTHVLLSTLVVAPFACAILLVMPPALPADDSCESFCKEVKPAKGQN